MENDHIRRLFQRFIDDEHTDEDFERIKAHFQRGDDRQTLLGLIEEALDRYGGEDTDHRIEPIIIRTDEGIKAALRNTARKRSVPLWIKIGVAAAALSLITVAYFLYFSHNAQRQDASIVQVIRPGRNTATVTDQNGRVFSLSEQRTGVVIKSGVLSYLSGEDISRKITGELTATTPRGGTYRFTLPDGTGVWLNAESQISFPVEFSTLYRTVRLKGEAYFEVAKDPAHPFVVSTEGQDLQVLGTKFNISSYQGEDVSTTLAEGSVKISAKGLAGRDETTILKPGDQSLLSAGKINVRSVDPQVIIAWTKGQFAYNDETLEVVMQKIARWYDVEVEFQGVDRTMKFWGGISRYERIEKVLEMLELTGGVHFRIQGRRIMVLK